MKFNYKLQKEQAGLEPFNYEYNFRYHYSKESVADAANQKQPKLSHEIELIRKTAKAKVCTECKSFSVMKDGSHYVNIIIQNAVNN